LDGSGAAQLATRTTSVTGLPALQGWPSRVWRATESRQSSHSAAAADPAKRADEKTRKTIATSRSIAHLRAELAVLVPIQLARASGFLSRRPIHMQNRRGRAHCPSAAQSAWSHRSPPSGSIHFAIF